MHFEAGTGGRFNVYLGSGCEFCIGCVTQVLPGVWVFQSRALFGLMIGKGGTREAAVRSSGVLTRVGRWREPTA